MARGQATTRTTTNREEIRRWVESKGGWPARVKAPNAAAIPGFFASISRADSGAETLKKMSWDDWFRWFDKKKLAFLHQPTTRFSKLIARETAAARAGIRATPRACDRGERATAQARDHQARHREARARVHHEEAEHGADDDARPRPRAAAPQARDDAEARPDEASGEAHDGQARGEARHHASARRAEREANVEGRGAGLLCLRVLWNLRRDLEGFAQETAEDRKDQLGDRPAVISAPSSFLEPPVRTVLPWSFRETIGLLLTTV